MAKSGLKHIDVGAELTKTEWESEETHELLHGNSFPSSPVERQLFYRDDEHKWYIYDGSAWVWLGGGGGGGGMQVHGNEYHDPDFASEAALSSHAAAATGVHGVGADTIAKVGDIAIDSNLSAAAQDAIAKKHSQDTDKILVDADNDTKIQVEKTADEDKIHMDVKGVEAFLLEDTGILTVAKQSKARAYLSAQQTIPNTTWTKVNLDAESFDEQNEFANYKFTASKAGAYLLIGKTVYWFADVVAQKMYAANIYKNGVGFSDMWVQSAISAKALIVLVADVAKLNVNDYIELYSYHETGSNCRVNNGESQTSLTVFKVV
jgi:hypothetical protein